MEIKSTQFDQTNPFAQLEQRAAQAQTYLRQIPPQQRAQILDAILPPVVGQPHPGIEPAVRMVSVKVEEWDGGAPAQSASPNIIFRPRRIQRPVPWQLRLLVAGIRLTRILQRASQQQMKQAIRQTRRLMRRVLPRQKAMRGARPR